MPCDPKPTKLPDAQSNTNNRIRIFERMRENHDHTFTPKILCINIYFSMLATLQSKEYTPKLSLICAKK